MQIITLPKWQNNIDFKVLARKFRVVNNQILITTREGHIILFAEKMGEFHVETRHRELTKKKLKKVHIFS